MVDLRMLFVDLGRFHFHFQTRHFHLQWADPKEKRKINTCTGIIRVVKKYFFNSKICFQNSRLTCLTALSGCTRVLLVSSPNAGRLDAGCLTVGLLGPSPRFGLLCDVEFSDESEKIWKEDPPNADMVTTDNTKVFPKNDQLQDAGYPLNVDREKMVTHTYFLHKWRNPRLNVTCISLALTLNFRPTGHLPRLA
jgi:hypothetical protein